jgi:hypothetical protein
MTTKTVREVKIRDARRQSDERVVIEHVHIVMARKSVSFAGVIRMASAILLRGGAVETTSAAPFFATPSP